MRFYRLCRSLSVWKSAANASFSKKNARKPEQACGHRAAREWKWSFCFWVRQTRLSSLSSYGLHGSPWLWMALAVQNCVHFSELSYEKAVGRPKCISRQHTLRQVGPGMLEKQIGKRRRDPFTKETWRKPQEWVTKTISEDRTRNYPTHSQKIAVSHQKKKILGEGWPRERKMSTETQPNFNKTRGELTTKLTR